MGSDVAFGFGRSAFPPRPDHEHLAAVPSRDVVHDACDLLKALAHEGRLLILMHLAQREHPVRELEQLLDLRQPAVSQQLARLRADGLVHTRREGKMVFYSLASLEVRRFVETLVAMLARKSEGIDWQEQDPT